MGALVDFDILEVPTVADAICLYGAIQIGGDENTQIVSKGQLTVTVVRITAPADSTWMIFVSTRLGDNNTSSDGDISTGAVLTATDACAIVVTFCMYIAAVDVHNSTVASFTAADAGRIRAAVGLHMAAVDDEGATSFAIAAAYASAMRGSVSPDITAVDGDSPCGIVTAILGTADASRLRLSSGSDGSVPDGQFTV